MTELPAAFDWPTVLVRGLVREGCLVGQIYPLLNQLNKIK